MATPATPKPERLAPLAGLDLAHIAADADRADRRRPTAGTARLTLDAELQRTALGLMSAHHLPEGAIVLMDAATGRLLVYASHVDKGPPRDLCAEATAPSASVFKIVTAAALIEDAHLEPDTKQCYSGGESRINAIDLVDDPQRDRWCTTLAGAMGRSINTVFARLASEHLAPPQLEAMARRFGYGQARAVRRAGAAERPARAHRAARVRADRGGLLELDALAAAGRGDERDRRARRRGGASGHRATRSSSGAGAVLWSAPDEPQTHRVLARETADQITTMMEQTVRDGTSWQRVPRPARRDVPAGHRGRGQDGHADRRRSPPLLHVVHRASRPRTRRRPRARSPSRSSSSTGRRGR